ncbi:hypothetical protein CK203_041820 [Vitis vinifera]|uniref:Uncharacterized protein n=1 Tax=Vitis vinifera TaxID=29760 RepID=A0A438HHK2_VITVI|nr:hypothetical protein CK203_041820 [Vitis vinifera]
MRVAEREGAMKNTIRCCISCILPCGALDVVRIVHSNGHVEEISGTITASEIMKAHPKHVLKKPSSSSEEGVVPKIVVVPPDAELQRGKIYFLMPIPHHPKRLDRDRRHGRREEIPKATTPTPTTTTATPPTTHINDKPSHF